MGEFVLICCALSISICYCFFFKLAHGTGSLNYKYVSISVKEIVMTSMCYGIEVIAFQIDAPEILLSFFHNEPYAVAFSAGNSRNVL